eukprot:TRINITY_DN30525_c0_g1_i1.p1 TRINITY_DN30525_c0_g1~~TRINITY_DN30525_c0_g1_i1.p1  ORF type:complete len:350 (-),score=48.62 TRINITY_DN30525_c0_g1_i1:139-1188(-)
MVVLGDLASVDVVPRTIVVYSGVDSMFAFAAGSTLCRGLCEQALRVIQLQPLGGPDPAAVLLRLVASSLTRKGDGIEEINACFCRTVSSATLKSLPRLPSLVNLNLDGCQEVDDEGLLAVAQRCKSLRSFSLYWNVKATDKGLARLMRVQQNGVLRTVCFSGCKQLGDDTVQRIVSRGQQLDVLDLTRCPKVSDDGVLLLCESLSTLRVLRLYAMAQLSPLAFTTLRRLPRLVELDLCGCRVEDDSLVSFLEAASPSPMETLNLTWCPALTDVAVLAVAKCCPRLQWFSVFGNTNLSGSAIEALAAAPCGRVLHSLDVRGLSRAPQYSQVGLARLQNLFPKLANVELHH